MKTPKKQSLLGEFWESKKHVIQFVGILTAIGAIFLAIPVPEDDVAKTALQNIQVTWLVIISISIAVLFVNLWLLAVEVEKKLAEKKILLNVETTALSLIVTGISIFLLHNLWRYVLAIYKIPLFSLLKSTRIGINLLIWAILGGLAQRLLTKLSKEKYIYINGSIILLAIVGAFSTTAVLGYLPPDSSFSLANWIESSARTFLFVIVGLAGLKLFRLLKKKFHKKS